MGKRAGLQQLVTRHAHPGFPANTIIYGSKLGPVRPICVFESCCSGPAGTCRLGLIKELNGVQQLPARDEKAVCIYCVKGGRALLGERSCKWRFVLSDGFGTYCIIGCGEDQLLPPIPQQVRRPLSNISEHPLQVVTTCQASA